MRDHVIAADAPVTEVVPLGADVALFGPDTIDGSTPPRPGRLVHVAGLNLVKDQDLLLHAFALAVRRTPSLTLTIAGGDTLDGRHRRLADELHLGDRVEFLGHVPHDGLADVLRGADVHVLTSHHDAGPIAVLEAAMCGVPTVGTAVGHVADFAALPRPAALAVDGRDPTALADAIVGLVDDRARRDDHAGAARTWALRHDATFTADTFELLYRRLMGEV
jgi:glycosyltransferase involved in cell wall biosynthesis